MECIMERPVVTPSFAQCCKRMWTDAAGAWRARPRTALFLFVVCLLLWVRLFALPQASESLGEASTLQKIYMSIEICLWYGALALLPLWVFGVYRFVVRHVVCGGEPGQGGWPFDRDWLRTVAWAVVGWAVMAV